MTDFVTQPHYRRAAPNRHMCACGASFTEEHVRDLGGHGNARLAFPLFEPGQEVRVACDGDIVGHGRGEIAVLIRAVNPAEFGLDEGWELDAVFPNGDQVSADEHSFDPCRPKVSLKRAGWTLDRLRAHHARTLRYFDECPEGDPRRVLTGAKLREQGARIAQLESWIDELGEVDR